MNGKERVYLVISEGCLSMIGCRTPDRLQGVDFVLVDYDCEGFDNVSDIRQSENTGDVEPALVSAPLELEQISQITADSIDDAVICTERETRK